MKKIKYLRFITLSLLLFVGCNDFLDEVPDNRTELNDSEKIGKLLTSAYPQACFAVPANAMSDGAIARTLSPSSPVDLINEDAFHWRDVRSDNIDSPQFFWEECYKAIAGANHALVAIAALPNQTEVQQYQRSEALLCRAFAHFLLVNLFAKTYEPGKSNNSPGVPYVDMPEVSVMPKYERHTVAYVYQRIEEDLEEALKTIAPESHFKVPAYHFTEKAAFTFASRFYLYKGDYEKVIEFTSRIVPKPSVFLPNGNVSSVDAAAVWGANYMARFSEWTNDAAFIRPAFRSASGNHNFLLQETFSLLEREYSFPYGTQLDDYLPNNNYQNVSGGFWVFTAGAWAAVGSGFIVKIGEYFYLLTENTGYPMVMFPYIRAEEALLNRAEAEIHLNRMQEAINDLNIYYRYRSCSVASQITTPYIETTMVVTQAKINAFHTSKLDDPNMFLTKYNAFGSASWSRDRKALMMTLLDTRKAEFIHEGARWLDILRYKIPVTHTNRNGITMELLPDDARRLWQLPEVTKLAGLVPNPR